MHDHAHHPMHGNRARNRVRLACTLCLTLTYMLAEIIGGYLSGSLALLADAGHMFSDSAALALSLFAAWISARPPAGKWTYGYYRAEILAALANGATLVAIAIVIVIEAIGRLQSPAPVAGLMMLSVAAGGLTINLIGLAILSGGRNDNLNIQGAWLHVMFDALGSVAALLAGGAIWMWGWNWIDPLVSILIAVLITYSAWNLIKQAVAILMESSPAHLDPDEVRRAILSLPCVAEVHDLHVWTITSGMVSLSAHVALAEGHDAGHSLSEMGDLLRDQFDIHHTTIQIEPAGHDRCHTPF